MIVLESVSQPCGTAKERQQLSSEEQNDEQRKRRDSIAKEHMRLSSDSVA